MRVVVFSLMVMALLHAFTPYLSDSKAAVSRVEIEDLARQTQMMTPDEVVLQLKQASRPTMLVVYASWCHYCRQLMPSIYQLWNEKKIAGDQMLLVSLDEQFNELATYLLENRFNRMLGVPIMIKADNKSALRIALNPLGASFSGGIPYIGFFGKGGQMIDEIHGAVEKNDIEDALVNLK